MRVAAVQFPSVQGDKSANLAIVARFVEQAAARGVELILFPECALTGYWFLRKLSREALADLAEEVPAGPATQTLLALAARHAMTVSAGLVERTADGRLFNTQVVASPDGRTARHRKLHAFVSEHLSCGDEYTLFDLPGGRRVGVLTCYDNNLIENVRATALRGAEILLAPHQTGGCKSGSPFAMGLVERRLWDLRFVNPRAIAEELAGDKGRGWIMRWLPARAHDNGLFLLFANGVGPDDDEIRTGNATIFDCYGRVLAATDVAAEAMVVADLDFSLRERCTGVRWMRARRPELYGILTERQGNELGAREARFRGVEGFSAAESAEAAKPE